MSTSTGPRVYKAPPTFITPNNPSFATYMQGEEWDSSIWFRALTRAHGPPGGKTTYDEPRPQGFHIDSDANDYTSFVYGQAELTEHHWPDVMYLLRPPPEREAYLTKAAPGQLHDAAGLPMVEKWPIVGRQARPLKELAGLPDCISSNETWDRIEFWRRLNPRILMEDILMRMHPDMVPRTTVGDTRLRNSLNMRASRRAYPEYCLISWFGKGLDGGRLKHTARDETLLKLTQPQIAANTTRGSTPGLVNPSMGERPGNRIQLPKVNNSCLTRRCGGRQAISRYKAGETRKRGRKQDEDEEEGEEEEEVTRRPRKKVRKGGERARKQRVDVLVDARDKIGAFRDRLGISGHPRSSSRGSMPPGTFAGPPNALISGRDQGRSSSAGAGEEEYSPEEYSPEVYGNFVAQFEDDLPPYLRLYLGGRQQGVPSLRSAPASVSSVVSDRPAPVPALPWTPRHQAPFPPPPGTCDPSTLTSSPAVAAPMNTSDWELLATAGVWQEDEEDYDLQNSFA